MGADDGRINQQMFQVTVLGEMLEQLLKNPEFTPTGEGLGGLNIAYVFLNTAVIIPVRKYCKAAVARCC